MNARLPYLLGSLVAVAALYACGGNSTAVPSGGLPFAHKHSGGKIQHIVLMVQENRTFNNLFATFPNVTGTTTGLERVGSGKKAKTVQIALAEVRLVDKKNLNHLYASYQTAYRSGNMDAFNKIRSTVTGKTEGKLPYQYVQPSDVVPYWTLATDYGIADMMFQTQGSGSFTAHQDLIRGGTEIDPTESLVRRPDFLGCLGLHFAAWYGNQPHHDVAAVRDAQRPLPVHE